MSGHSKWAGIKHKKAALDAKRGKVFSKLNRELITAARIGGGDLEANARLRVAAAKARAANMPSDTIQRAIRKGLGELEGESYEETRFEGYAPGGVAVLVEILTDNRNRTVADLRRIFTRNGGNPGEPGSVAWMFEMKGYILLEGTGAEEDELLAIVLDAGAEDLVRSDNSYEVTTSVEDFDAVKSALQEKGYTPAAAEVTMVPQSTVRLEGKEAQQCLRLVEMLEDHDDVQNVYINFDIPDDVLASFAS